jgi:Periplasmic binding protein domain
MTKGQWRFPISIQDVVRRRPCLRPGKKLRPTSNHEQTQNVQPLRSRCHGRRYRAPPESPTYPLRRTEEDVPVVRIAGIPWFNALENGAKKAGRDFGIHASVVGPAHLDPAPQVKLLEDLIAQKVDVIGHRPFPRRRRDRYRLQNDARRYQNLPEPEGHFAFGSNGPIGAGSAVRDKGLSNKIAVIGTVVPSQAKPLIMDATIREGHLWNPTDAGYAMVAVAKLVLGGTPIVDGVEIPGLGKTVVDVDNKQIKVQKIMIVNKDTVDGLIKQGL